MSKFREMPALKTKTNESNKLVKKKNKKYKKTKLFHI